MIIEFSNEIRDVLVALLEDNIVVTSWGLSNLTVKDGIIFFSVNGLKYKGEISIKVSDLQSGYDLHIGEKTIKGCKLNLIVKTIDYEVEYSPNYMSQLLSILNVNCSSNK